LIQISQEFRIQLSGFEVGVVGCVIVFLRSLHSEIIAVMQMTHQLRARRELEQVQWPWNFAIKKPQNATKIESNHNMNISKYEK
jgi:hypothetical protein